MTGGALAVAGAPPSGIAVAAAGDARAAAQAGLDADRWSNEGGSFAAEAGEPLQATSAGG
jgi:hypothetical protein